MMQTLIAGQPMRFTLRLEDTTGAAVALDAKPVSGDFVFRDQDGVRAGTVTIEDFTTGHGYDVEFVPTTPFAIGEQISVRCAAVKNSAAIVFFEQGVVEGSSAIVAPVVGNAPERVEGTTLKAFVGEDWSQPVSGFDTNGNIIDWTLLGALVFVLEGQSSTDKLVIADANITKTTTAFQVAIPRAYNKADKMYNWAIKVVGTQEPVLYGNYLVEYVAQVDA
jgi:hypothetical protein